MKFVVLTSMIVFSFVSQAKVDIDYKMKLLEENVKNAEANFGKYKENLQISIKNFNEATRIVNELRGLKKQALRDKKRAKTNSLVFGQVTEKYTEFVAAEQAQILKEEDTVRKLQALIAKIQENTEKRRGLIAGYEGETEKARAEIEKWRQKERDVASVMEDIKLREVQALDERKAWGDKKETYRTETKKWSRESGKAKRVYATFERLRD